MLRGISSALAGLSVAQARADAASRNIANANTDGYHKVVARAEETTPGSVSARVETVDTPGPVVAQSSGNREVLVEKSNVELVEEVTAIDLAKLSFRANLKTLRAQDEMLGSLLDLFR